MSERSLQGSNLPRKDDGVQEEVKRRCRKKMKVMPSLRKALTISCEVSPVTQLQGRESVKVKSMFAENTHTHVETSDCSALIAALQMGKT